MSEPAFDPLENDCSCPACGGSGGYLACIESFCTCADGDECFVPCQTCDGEGEIG